MAKGHKMKMFSFFAGCGILDLGFEKAGYDIEFVNEFFKPFQEAYIYSRKVMGIRPPKYGYANTDINSYINERKDELIGFINDAKKDGSLIGFIGGPPCPDFSIAGKQRGRDGDNGKLSFSYISLLTTMKPDFFLFENVKGLWKTARPVSYTHLGRYKMPKRAAENSRQKREMTIRYTVRYTVRALYHEVSTVRR